MLQIACPALAHSRMTGTMCTSVCMKVCMYSLISHFPFPLLSLSHVFHRPLSYSLPLASFPLSFPSISFFIPSVSNRILHYFYIHCIIQALTSFLLPSFLFTLRVVDEFNESDLWLVPIRWNVSYEVYTGSRCGQVNDM